MTLLGSILMGTQKTRVKLIGSPVKSKQDTNMAKGLVRKRKGGKRDLGGSGENSQMPCRHVRKFQRTSPTQMRGCYWSELVKIVCVISLLHTSLYFYIKLVRAAVLGRVYLFLCLKALKMIYFWKIFLDPVWEMGNIIWRKTWLPSNINWPFFFLFW